MTVRGTKEPPARAVPAPIVEAVESGEAGVATAPVLRAVSRRIGIPGLAARVRLTRIAVALFATLAMAFALAVVPVPGGVPSMPTAHADDATTSTSGGASGGSGASGDTATPISGPVPNVIITNFTYGDGSVAVGSDFTLAFTFQNKGKVAVSNMVVTVDGGENFAIAGGTNTFYFDTLYAGRSATQSVPMQALSSAKSGAQGVTVGFRYEYVDSGSRSSASSDIRISVPVSQPDRFQLDDPVPPQDATVGTETTITMNYVNKGKGDIANVEASIEGEGLETTTKTQYIGNVASGANGSIGFAFTPTKAGSIEAKLHIAYEDSDGKPQTKEFPVTVDVADAAPVPDDSGMNVDDQSADQGVPAWVWGLVALGVVAVIVIVVVVVRRRRKRKAKKDDIDEEWDEWNGPASDGDGGENDKGGKDGNGKGGRPAGSPGVVDSVPSASAVTETSIASGDHPAVIPVPSADPEATQLIVTPQVPSPNGPTTSAGTDRSARSGRAHRGRA